MIDTSEFDALMQKFENAQNDIKKFSRKFLDEVGEEFLTIVQEEIERAENVDERLMLSSFSKGSGYGVYELDMGACTLTVGTNIEYAKWVNDGHEQKAGRFIPGVWHGDRFQYIPGAKTGMVLKASFVSGSHFFDKSVETLDGIFPRLAKGTFEKFFKRYFS